MEDLKPMFKNNLEQYKLKNKRPNEIDLRLKIQQERDFTIAKALSENRASEIFEINNLPDEHFKKIIEAREKKQVE